MDADSKSGCLVVGNYPLIAVHGFQRKGRVRISYIIEQWLVLPSTIFLYLPQRIAAMDTAAALLRNIIQRACLGQRAQVGFIQLGHSAAQISQRTEGTPPALLHQLFSHPLAEPANVTQSDAHHEFFFLAFQRAVPV